MSTIRVNWLRGVLFLVAACMALDLAPADAHYATLVEAQNANVQDARCQSYTLAIALAWRRDRAFDLEHVDRLQETMRSIDAAANSASNQRTFNRDELDRWYAQSHEDFATAVSNATRGSYELTWIDVEPENRFGSIGSAKPTLRQGRVLPLGEAIPQPIFLATRRVDGRRMSFGSLVPIFGVRPAPRRKDPKAVELLTLSPGLMFEDDPKKRTISLDCRGNSVDQTTSEYVVRLAWVPETWFEWRHYAGRVRIFSIEKGRRHAP